ncbi:SIS domain-containing protein [Vallicoccus soli]|uniref:SIS domain-containing protein n=2 Tax=Vallicoccus soli TaxID=2339232 RepID=A0A3A3YZV9_9ACTN|nr:SIS domain-containing protein [Vallicoccus soli]
MAREIAEQPEAVARTLDALLPLVPELAALARPRRRVLLAGRGTSDNAAVYGRYVCEALAGVPAALAAPSVATHYGARLDLSDTLVVSLSQSGSTGEIVETQRWARDCGAATLAVTNTAGSPLTEEADLAFVTEAGPERAVPATKTFTTALVAVGLLLPALTGREPEGLRALPDAVAEAVGRGGAAERAASVLAARRGGTVVTGRGLTFPVALETGLKLEETCLRPVRGLSYADLQHGPRAVLDGTTAVVVVAPTEGPVLPDLTAFTASLPATGAAVVGLGGDEALGAHCDPWVRGPVLGEALSAVTTAVLGQLVAERLAAELGLDPDAPRGLRKVTQTEARTA